MSWLFRFRLVTKPQQVSQRGTLDQQTASSARSWAQLMTSAMASKSPAGSGMWQLGTLQQRLGQSSKKIPPSALVSWSATTSKRLLKQQTMPRFGGAFSFLTARYGLKRASV